MSGKGIGWLKGCAIGCGVVFALSILMAVGCSLTLLKPFKGAIESRHELDEIHGQREDYRPPPNGAVPADRLEAFMAIREDLMTHCKDFDEVFDQFARMDHLDDQDEVPRGVMFREVVHTIGSAMGLAGKVGGFAVARNQALLDGGMGLGEYTYIYSLVYCGWLGKTIGGTDSGEVDHVHAEVDNGDQDFRRALRSMIGHQLDDLQALPVDQRGGLRLEDLLEEAARLNEDRRRMPWQDGVPEVIAESLEPDRERLESLWCEGSSSFELSRHRKRGQFTITSD